MTKRLKALLAAVATDDRDKLEDDDDDDNKEESQKACRSCGAYISGSAKFCSRCGASVVDDDPDRKGTSTAGGRAAASLYFMEQKVQSMVAASGGKLTKPQAYAQFLATPEGVALYTRYDRERENCSLTRDGREQYARSMHALMQSAGYGSEKTGIVDNLPRR